MATPRPMASAPALGSRGTSGSEGNLVPTARQPPLKRSMTSPLAEDTPESFVQRFVPDMVVERLFNGGAIQSQELSRYEQCVVGFFDVSGFSALARDLEQSDKASSEKALKRRSAISIISQHSISGKGAEELVRQLNETLSALIETIRAAGGDIIKFAGDAILVVWLCSEIEPMDCQLLRATECAIRCTTLKSDQSKLGLHVGIGCGELVACHVGGTFGRWEFFIAGEACTQSALAEHHAGVNQVVVSPQAKVILNGSKHLKTISGIDVDEDFFLVTKIEYQNLGPSTKPRYFLSSDPKVAKAAEGYVPGPVRDALKSGGSSSAAVGGLRKLTVIFFKLYDVVLPKKFDAESEKKFLEQCQNQAKLVQDSAYHYYATLRQFILDDKGFVAIVALGLPPFFHEDNAVRAVKVAKRLIEHHKIRATAGICTGTVFCGVVGSSKRAEYSVAGSCINLAARLMAKATPGTIWCDATTKSEAESVGHIRFEQFPSQPFKGFDQPVEIYGPIMSTATTPGPKASTGNSSSSVTASGTSLTSVAPAPASEALNRDGASSNKTPSPASAFSAKMEREDSQTFRGKRRFKQQEATSKKPVAIVGMEAEQTAMARAAFLGGSSPVRICFVEGEAGSGKSRLVEWVMKETGAKTSILSTGDSSETNTPFFVWRTILQSILAVSRPSKSSSFVDMSVSAAGQKDKSVAAAMPSRKRGYSAEDVSPSRKDASAQPPLPTHRRNVSAERMSLGPPSQALSAAVPTHRRSHSNTSTKSETSPLRKEITVTSSNRASRGDSIFGDIVQTTSDIDEGEEDDEVVEAATTKDEQAEEEDTTKQQDQEHPRMSTDDEPLIAHPPVAGPPSGLSRLSMDTSGSGNSPHSTSSTTKRFGFLGQHVANNTGTYLPEDSIVLERLHDTGRLRGKRLSCLHAIIPNLVIPLMEANDPGNPIGNTGSEAAAPTTPPTSLPQAALSTASLLATRIGGGTPQRRTSFSQKPFAGPGSAGPSSQTSTVGSPLIIESKHSSAAISTASTTVGGTASSAATSAVEPISDAQASMELMMLLLEECGIIGSTLIVIENAQFMDKPSWELLRKCCEMGPPSWKGEHRVRFIVTFRPFLTPREHPLQMILHGGLHGTGSVPTMSSPAPSASSAPPPVTISIGSPILPTKTFSEQPSTSVVSSAQSTPTNAGNGQQTSFGGSSATSSQQADQGSTVPGRVSSPPPFERVSSTLSAITQTRGSRRKSIEQVTLQSQLVVRTSGGSEVRSDVEKHEDEPWAIKVTVQPFTAREAGVFLSNVHSVAIGPNLLRFIFKRGRGNPRALLECFKALQDQDLINVDPATGTVEETTPLEDIGDMVFIIPLHLRAQLQQQFDKLMNREQLILKLASVAGSSFSMSLVRWLYKQRVLQQQQQQQQQSPSLSAAVEGGQIVDAKSEELAIDLDFDEGVKELRERGVIRPFLHHNQPEYERSTNGSDVAGQRPAGGRGSNARSSDAVDDFWLLESEQARFLVYSQMLHTLRREVHGQVLDWYLSRPAQTRIREDPVMLANHALGAERPNVAFQCFREGLRRVVFKAEQVSRGERLWQSCTDVLDDSSTGFSAHASSAHRIAIDVLMGHVCIQNEGWDDGKAYFNRALEAAEKLLLEGQSRDFSRRRSFRDAGGGLWGSCFPFGRRRRSSSRTSLQLDSATQNTFATGGSEAYPTHERDPLTEAEFQPLLETKANAELARTFLKRIQDLQDSYARMVSGLKKSSLQETADRD